MGMSVWRVSRTYTYLPTYYYNFLVIIIFIIVIILCIIIYRYGKLPGICILCDGGESVSAALQHNAFPFQRFGLFFPSLLFFTVPFSVAFRGGRALHGGHQSRAAKKLWARSSAPRAAPIRANTLFGPRLLAVLCRTRVFCGFVGRGDFRHPSRYHKL